MGLCRLFFENYKQNRKINRRLDQIMGRLQVITDALAAAESVRADEAAQVQAHFDRLTGLATTLQETVDALTAASVTDEEIADVQEQVAALAVGIEAIDTEGEGVPEPEPTPEPTPEPEPVPEPEPEPEPTPFP